MRERDPEWKLFLRMMANADRLGLRNVRDRLLADLDCEIRHKVADSGQMGEDEAVGDEPTASGLST